MLAHYLKYLGPDGRHDFTKAPNKTLGKRDFIAIADGTYEAFVSHPQYRSKKDADRISYFWDDLIGRFTKHIVAGTSISVDGQEPMGPSAEPGLRIMALESRVHRRLLGNAFLDALDSAISNQQDRFFRTLLPDKHADNPDTAYVVCLMAYRPFFDNQGGYEAYRKLRAATLVAYCYSVRYKYKFLKWIVGIAVDTPDPKDHNAHSSEDLVAIGKIEWTEDLSKEVVEAGKNFNIMQNAPREYIGGTVHEYPQEGKNLFQVEKLSRQQRRALERRTKKRNR